MSWVGSFLTWSFKRELYEGLHDFRVDVFKMALYSTVANLSPNATIGYTTDGELPALGGYTAGGKQTLAYAPRVTATGTVIVDFENVEWNPATFSARGGLLYNASKSGWPSVFVLDFQIDRIPNAGRFIIEFPAGNELSAILRTP